VSGGAVGALAAEYWEAMLALSPVFATHLGDRRYDARLDDNTPEGLARARALGASFLERARALPPERDRLTRTLFISWLEIGLASADARLEEWVVDAGGGPQVWLLNLESFQPVRTPAEARDMVARWRAMGPYLAAHTANLRRGLAAGKTPARAAVERVIAQLDELLAKPDRDSPLLRPLRTSPDGAWSAADRAALEDAVATAARPGFASYRAFLAEEALPRARGDDQPGLAHVPGGAEAYRLLIRANTSLDLAPEDLHRTGFEELARIHEELSALGAKALGVRDLGAILARLRGDRTLYFASRDEVAAKAEAALARARAAIPAFFGILPRAGCEVARMEEHEEKHSTIAYYRQPAADGSRPGRYTINTSSPETRPRYEAEALAYHESIPGHHLQIAIAQELPRKRERVGSAPSPEGEELPRQRERVGSAPSPEGEELTGLPEFRKHCGSTAFIEGWALYAERLADEMGLYSSDLDRIGMLSFEAWRAARLVVDTGIHALGWTRGRAIEFMLATTALAENNVVNEVDRYAAWPAQALAYKTGEIEIRRLRAEARRRLGARFDLPGFHDAVLGNGALDLGPLREEVEAWIAGRAEGPA
jgi:uncharacterized protein (DUF885 family)